MYIFYRKYLIFIYYIFLYSYKIYTSFFYLSISTFHTNISNKILNEAGSFKAIFNLYPILLNGMIDVKGTSTRIYP